jgi:hypothetical protein
LDSIQNSGKLTIENGKLVAPPNSQRAKKDPSLSDLNNLLVTIDNFSAELPLSDASAQNRVKMTVVFYVKGRTYVSFMEMRAAVAQKVHQTRQDIAAAVQTCKDASAPGCSSDAVIAALGNIRSLATQASTLDSMASDMVKNTNVSDLPTEFDKIFSLYGSWKTLDASFRKEKAVLNAATGKKASS